VWIGIRGFLLFVGLTVPSLPAAVGIVTLTAWLTVWDGRRHGETVLLANLGVPQWRLAVVAALPAVVFETVIQVLA
jgi:hypothetical protein